MKNIFRTSENISPDYCIERSTEKLLEEIGEKLNQIESVDWKKVQGFLPRTALKQCASLVDRGHDGPVIYKDKPRQASAYSRTSLMLLHGLLRAFVTADLPSMTQHNFPRQWTQVFAELTSLQRKYRLNVRESAFPVALEGKTLSHRLREEWTTLLKGGKVTSPEKVQLFLCVAGGS